MAITSPKPNFLDNLHIHLLIIVCSSVDLNLNNLKCIFYILSVSLLLINTTNSFFLIHNYVSSIFHQQLQFLLALFCVISTTSINFELANNLIARIS